MFYGARGTAALNRIAFSAVLVLGLFAAAAACSVRALALDAPVRPHVLRLTVRHLWTRSFQPNADSAPAYVPRVRVNGRVRALVFVLAGNNRSNCDQGDPVRRATLYAFDARSGNSVWTRATTGASRCTTAGPIVDSAGKYVYAPGLDGKMHRYGAAAGRESIGGGWPIAITLMPDVEKISATPTIAGRYLYVTTSGFIGDRGHYEGHLVSIDRRTGRSHIFNSLCSNVHALLGPSPHGGTYCSSVESGMFGRGQGIVDSVTRDVYVVTGNGPWNGHTEWGDSILRLDPTGAHLLDSFTPTNQGALAAADQDLGSSGSALLSPIKSGGRTYHLLVQAGKGPACASCGGAALRLLNRDDLSGHHGPGHLGGDLYDTLTPGGDEVLTAPAVWRSPKGDAWDFVATGSGVAGYRVVTAGKAFRLRREWLDTPGGSTPILSRGILYVASSGRLRALDPATGTILWRSSDIGDVHWEYPRITGNFLFVTDEGGHMYAYALTRSTG